MAEVKYLDKTGLSTVWSKVKGIVTPKADKVSGATAGHLAGLNSSGNLTDSGLPASNIAQKDGSYSGMTVGAAEDLVSAESVASEFTSRITGGSTAVGKGGTALVDKIKGRTLVWNQQFSNGDGSDGISGWQTGSVFSISNQSGKIRITEGATAPSTGMNIIAQLPGVRLPKTIGHKYLIMFDYFVSTTKSGYSLRMNFCGIDQPIPLVPLNQTTRYSQIITASSSTYTYFLITHTSNNTLGEGGFIEFDNLMCIDLTLMFGAGNEPSTPNEFEAIYPGPYYDYNAGTLVSNAAMAIETVGWNIWDEEWEVGGFVSGSINSKNFISVSPSITYYFKTPQSNVIFCYDANHNQISTGAAINTIFTTPANCAFIKFRMSTNYGTTYNNDICISLSDPSRNGTYEPYWRSELDLNIPTLTGKLNGTGNSVVIFPDGLRSAGTVYDEIVGNKAIKRIGAVDMGSLTWTYASSRFYSNAIETAKAGSTELVSTKYLPNTNNFFIGNNNRLYVVDSSYTDAAAFKASLSGVMLYYELATPEEYILDEAIPTAMRNDPYGTERRLPEDTAAIVTAPFRADITYSTNIKEAVQSLPQNYINVNSMQDFLAALGEQMGGTWMMRPADGKFDFTFTPNPSNE